MSSEEEEKKRGIKRAVRRNDVFTLRTLLDSPELYNIRSKKGHTLLQLAFLRRGFSTDPDSTFEYLLSLEDYPIDAVNDEGQTALMVALGSPRCSAHSDYIASRLIQRGVDIHRVCHTGKSALHYAFLLFSSARNIDTAILLVEKGVDINRQDDNGNTALHICCKHCMGEGLTKVVITFLNYGADPTIRNNKGHTAFDDLIMETHCYRTYPFTQSAAEHLFNHLSDEYTEYDIDIEILLAAAAYESGYFTKILKNIGTIFFNETVDSLWCKLFVIKPKYLRIFIDKFDYVIIEILKNASPVEFFLPRIIYVENFYILFESKLQSKFVEWLCEVDMWAVVLGCLRDGMPEAPITELVCFLLSYGMTVPTKYLHLVFEQFGYCELLKIMLHMDLTFLDDPINSVMPRLLYDFNIDQQKFIQDPLTLTIQDLQQILPYFAIPKLKLICYDKCQQDKDIIEKIQKQPHIPLLLEMARNVFRKYFVQRLNIANARQFYTQLNLLPIGNYYKQIIRLEAKLY